ncbi:aminoacyl-histidine dipeptidase [Desulfobacterales bacterium HSG16]|nr:aminoacyl-histidine dipeptidase [Desulfobacterales bacterium HSG16]
MNEKTSRVLEIFERINQIPRESKNEEKIAQWIRDWAEKRQFPVKSDHVGNLVIDIPASSGCESGPIIVLQGHMDMVCEKSVDSRHDFSKDPIRHIIEGEWLRADNTSLGADNGIAIAIAMALADDPDIIHPELELLFTVDEETGLTGANAMEPGFFEGRILINIDSEDEGVFTIGCAGGVDSHFEMALSTEPAKGNNIVCDLSISGLKGGHSGIDINKGRANANNLLARAIRIMQSHTEIRLLSFSGGTTHNAIPRNAAAQFLCSEQNLSLMQEKVLEFEAILQKEYQISDPGLSLSLNLKADSYKNGQEEAITQDDTDRVIRLLLAFPWGVSAMSEVPGLVETSSNLASVNLAGCQLNILSSQRSSVMTRLDEITIRIESLGMLAGASIKNGLGYPCWTPDTGSALLKQCREVYVKLFDKIPEEQIIHAGLECAIIGSRYKGIDMISIGPTIRNPHSPEERLHIPSVGKIWEFMTALLKSYS